MIRIKQSAEHPDTVELHVSGVLGGNLVQDFTRAYLKYPKGKMQFVVDLAETENIESYGIGMLLSLKEYAVPEKTIRLVNANERVLSALKMANLQQLAFALD